MSHTPLRPSDDHLAAMLIDLGAHLDVGPESPDVLAADAAAVVERITAARQRPDRRRWLVAAAIVLVVASTAIAVVAPAREAVARWLGIGAVAVRTGSTVVGTSTSSVPDGGGTPIDVGSLQAALPFELRLLDPALAGAPLAGSIDEAAPAALVEVRYADVTLVEVATRPGGSAALGKMLGPDTELTQVTVNGAPGFWIEGAPHDLAYLAPDGSFVTDTVRRAGNVLLWERSEVTYRIEGAASLDDALALAVALR